MAISIIFDFEWMCFGAKVQINNKIINYKYYFAKYYFCKHLSTKESDKSSQVLISLALYYYEMVCHE